MKKIKMGLIALATIAGIGGAFAFNHHARPSGTIYYAHKDSDRHVRWYTTSSGRCSSYSSLACTITSTSSVSGVVDAFPSQYSLAGSKASDAVYQ